MSSLISSRDTNVSKGISLKIREVSAVAEVRAGVLPSHQRLQFPHQAQCSTMLVMQAREAIITVSGIHPGVGLECMDQPCLGDAVFLLSNSDHVQVPHGKAFNKVLTAGLQRRVPGMSVHDTTYR